MGRQAPGRTLKRNNNDAHGHQNVKLSIYLSPMQRLLSLLYLSLWAPLAVAGQSHEELYGNWQGYMSSAVGNYVFTLDLAEVPKDGTIQIRGLAMHNRSGLREVISLVGTVFSDLSIYLEDERKADVALEAGDTFSRLQFLLKYEGGDLVLDGHWQEYSDLRRYRKGRLVLRKATRKA